MKNFKKKLASLMAFTMLFSCVSFMSASAESMTGKSEIYSKTPPASAASEFVYDITNSGAGLTGEVKLEYDATILNTTVGDTFIALASAGMATPTKVESAPLNAAIKFNTTTSGNQAGIVAAVYKDSATPSSWTSKGVIPINYLTSGKKMHVVMTVNTETKEYDATVDGVSMFAPTDPKSMRTPAKATEMSKLIVMGTNAEQFKLTNVKITANGTTRNITEQIAAPTVASAVPSTLSVKYGTTSIETLRTKLPTTGKLKLSDDSTVDVPVTWTEGDYNKTTPGTYTWTGTITPPEGIENPLNITTTTLEITVGPAPTNTLTEWVAGDPAKVTAESHEIPMQEGTVNFEFWMNLSEKDPSVEPKLNSIVTFGGEENVFSGLYPAQKMPVVVRAYYTSATDICIDTFNGASAAKLNAVPVEANGKYKVNLSIDLTNHNFDMTVNGVQVADDYAFRTTATAPTAITKVNVFGNAIGNAGEMKVTNFKIGETLYGAFESAETLNITAATPIAEKVVAAGTAFDALKLPHAVKVTTSGAPTSVGVTWEQGTYDAEKPGTYTITGTLATTEGITNTQNIKAEIVVAQGLKTIASVAPAAPVKVVTGTPAAEIKLPATVTATLSDSTTAEVAVTWDTTNYSPENGEYTLTGTITEPENVRNTSNLKAEVLVIVSDEVPANFQALTDAIDSAKYLLNDTTKSIHPEAKAYLEETIAAAEAFQASSPTATEEEVLTQAGIVNLARESAEAADLTEIEAIVAELKASEAPCAVPYAELAQIRLDELKALEFVVDAEVITLYKDMIADYATVVNAGTADLEGLEVRVAALETEVETGNYHVSLGAWTDWGRTLLTALQQSEYVPTADEIAVCESAVETAEALLLTTDLSVINGLLTTVLEMGNEAEGYAWAEFIQLRLQDPYLDSASLAEYQSILEGFIAEPAE